MIFKFFYIIVSLTGSMHTPAILSHSVQIDTCYIYLIFIILTGQSGSRNIFGSAENQLIQFNPDFSETPSVVLGLTNLDFHNVRIHAKVENVTKTGFTMSIRTWDDTILYNAGVSWMACPKYF